MIFIGHSLNNPGAHFVTNVVATIGTENDLIIDLRIIRDKDAIFKLISDHLQQHDERYVIYNAYENEDFILDFKSQFPNLTLFTFFSDDEWRHSNYDRYLALYSDFFSIAPERNMEIYHSYGLYNGMICQWACNPDNFYPVNEDKRYDVTFIGAPYGRRLEFIRFLAGNGVDFKVFGKGWEKYPDVKNHWGGYLSAEDMLKTISQSRINLNFTWTSRNPNQTAIKGRTMEIPACRSFQLSSHTDEFSNYGFIDGLNIATFQNKHEMLDKIKYYLTNENERESIADKAYTFVLENHTWEKRFALIFKRMEHCKESNTIPVFKILVVLQGEVTHSIELEDRRLEIHIKYEKDCAGLDFEQYEDIVFLSRDSTMNNETLYMMAFARHCDNSDVVLANFYITAKGENIWVRFLDKVIGQHRKFIKFLPREAMCFAPQAAKEFALKQANWDHKNLSFIEYPSFTVSGLAGYRKRLLKLCFGSYQHKTMFKNSVNRWRFGKALNVGCDYLMQREIKKRFT
ncbi:MAG: CgeB family protein [Bacteroidota bacterium]